MESYHEKIAPHSFVELIHVSRDQEVKEIEEWARKDKLPWPVLLAGEIPDEIEQYSPDGSVPDYILVDSAGEIVATGKNAAFEAINSHTR